MNATAAKNEWAIRPRTIGGTRRYVAVAKLADGSEVVITDGGRAFAAVRAARLAVIIRFDGGRAFPKAPKPFAYTEAYFAEQGAIARRHRVAC